MATKIASAAEIAAKWREVTPTRQRFYAENTPAAASDWESGALAAASTFQAAVSTGDIGRRFAGGVRKAGAAKFARKVTDVGAGRFSAGVQAAVQDMQSGFEPYQQVIASITPSKKGPRGDSGNIARVTDYTVPLAKKRLSLLGAGG